MHPDIESVLIDTKTLHARVEELGAAISAAATDSPILLVGILKGSVLFMADLLRAIQHPVMIDFIAVSSYGATTKSSGVVRMIKDLDNDLADKQVILVEDIIDSGLTLRYVRDMLQRRNPASLKVCALLNKPDRRQTDVEVEFIGFDIPNAFVVGYGLDYNEQYRQLPYIGVLKASVYSD